MWYRLPSNHINFTLKLNSKIQDEFISFCNEEIFFCTEKDSVDILDAKFNKKIFDIYSFGKIDEIFLLFVLNYFQEKKIKLNDENLMNFFSNHASNPTHILLMANSHNHATVKKAAQFLDLANPQDKELWKEYLADYQVLFSDRYFTSSEFNTLLDSKKNCIRTYLLEMEKIKIKTLDYNSAFDINLIELLKTDLIIKNPIKYKELIGFLFDMGFVSPTMLIKEGLTNQTIFEYTALRCQSSSIWWIEKMLTDHYDCFIFLEMIKYFESQIKSGFYLLDFKEQLKNYKEMLEFMKKVQIKKSLESSLIKKNINQDGLIKI